MSRGCEAITRKILESDDAGTVCDLMQSCSPGASRGCPAVKSLDRFGFAPFPALNKTLVMELARSERAIRRENIIAVGNSESDS
jgi:hypothetical protein